MWCLDVDWETRNFLSGAADNSCRLWDVNTGKQKSRIDTKSAVRTCVFAFSGNLVAYSTDKSMGHPCVINVVDVREFKSGKLTADPATRVFFFLCEQVLTSLVLSTSDKPVMTIPIPTAGPKVTAAIWGTLDEQLITGHDNGDIVQWDIKTHQKVKIVSDHMKSISDLQLSADRKSPSFQKEEHL